MWHFESREVGLMRRLFLQYRVSRRRSPTTCNQSILSIALWAAAVLVAGLPVHAAASSGSFPFTICSDQFCSDDCMVQDCPEGSEVFLNILGYAPLEPCQNFDDQIRERRVQDDLRRFQEYQGRGDPVLLRVYPQPTDVHPVRLRKSFYDGVRPLGFWIIRDVWLDENCDDNDPEAPIGTANIKAVIDEVEAAGAMDLIFAWEFLNEFKYDSCGYSGEVITYLENMCLYLKAELSTRGLGSFSNWVTWNSWPEADHIRSVPGKPPVHVPCLDYYSYNAYPYWPRHVRDHQGGHGTGTPFAGYLSALKHHVNEEYAPVKPLVISETGLPDSPSVGDATGDQGNLKPWYPTYRWGGLSKEQVAEGLTDGYWAARLTGMDGIAFFEWNDEWWKGGELCTHNDVPEEYYGLLSFDLHGPWSVGDPARYKLQQQTVQDLFRMQLPFSGWTLSVEPDDPSVPKDGTTTIRASLSGPPNEPALPVTYRWEASRGLIVGDSDTVQFYPGGQMLGPATVTVIASDANNTANIASTDITITTAESPDIQVLTLGWGGPSKARASGRVSDVKLGEFADGHKVAVYLYYLSGGTYNYAVQPFGNMKKIWVRSDGYWWTQLNNAGNNDLLACLVEWSFDPVDESGKSDTWVPDTAIDCHRIDTANDEDEDNEGSNDRLPDDWENTYFGDKDLYNAYDDPDDDDANNLEEFLAGTNPAMSDNDSETDGLRDTWELRYFGTLDYDANDDPDGDGLDNATEFSLGLHPGRTAADKDRDGLPDSWERSFFGDLSQGAGGNPDGDRYTNLDEYEFGKSPIEYDTYVPALSQHGVLVFLLLAAGAILVIRRRRRTR